MIIIVILQIKEIMTIFYNILNKTKIINKNHQISTVSKMDYYFDHMKKK